MTQAEHSNHWFVGALAPLSGFEVDAPSISGDKKFRQNPDSFPTQVLESRRMSSSEQWQSRERRRPVGVAGAWLPKANIPKLRDQQKDLPYKWALWAKCVYVGDGREAIARENTHHQCGHVVFPMAHLPVRALLGFETWKGVNTRGKAALLNGGTPVTHDCHVGSVCFVRLCVCVFACLFLRAPHFGGC